MRSQRATPNPRFASDRRRPRASSAVRDQVRVDGKPVLVRVGVVVRLRRQVDEDDVICAEIPQGMEDAGGNPDDRPPVHAEVVDVHRPIGRRLRAGVEQRDPGAS